MKKSTYLLSIILLSSSISGCTGEIDEATGEDEKGGTIIVTHDVMYSDARLDVSHGEENYEILLRLNHTAAPNHADNFRSHILQGNYDGVDFHRIIDDFMIQGGDFENRDGTGGFAANWYGWCNGVPIPIGECSEENYTVPDEVENGLRHYSCTISMAHAGSNTGGSQFFLIPGDVSHLHWLDGVHTVFGDVVGGCDYVTTLSGTETNNDRPIIPVTISSAEVSEVYIEQVETRLEAGADLRGADLSYANMSNLDLRGADLRAANLNYTMLQGADLRYADLRYTWLSGADLTGADLRQAGLHVAWLNGANLTGSNLNGAYLPGANLYDANLSGADLINAYLRYAILYDANLNSADLSGANLTYATMTGADLSYADLSYADLSGANLTGANLTGADLTGADLTGADLSYADLSGTIWYGTICPDGTNSDENGNTCENELQSDPFPYSCPIGSSISGTVTDSIYSNPGVVFSDDSNLPDDHNPQAIQFRVTLDGSPLEGCEIRFEIEDGNGWFFPAFRQTNNNGDLHGYWTAGSIIGDQTMSAYITWSSGERRYLNISGEVTDTSTRTNSIHLNYEPSGEYEEFSIRATPGTGPLATYYSTINWAGSYGGIQFDGDTTKVLFSTWDTNGMDAEIIDDGSCNVVHDFGGEGTGVSCRLILPPSVHGSIPGLPDDYMLVPGDTYETSIQISDCGTNCQDYSFFFTDITRGLGPISLGTQRYKSDWTNNWASSFVEEWWPHGNCLSAERSVLFHDVKAKVNGEWEYFDQARFTPNYIPSNNEICANYYAEGTEDGFQLSSGGDRLVGQPRISGDSYFPYTRYIDIIVG